MDVQLPTFLLALLLSLSLGCPPHLEVLDGLGTHAGHTQAQVRKRSGGSRGVPVYGCGSVCNARTEINPHIIAQIRPSDNREETQNQSTPETVTVYLEDTCRLMSAPGGGVKQRNKPILLVLFMWSRVPVEYKLVYKENCGINIIDIYLVRPGISKSGGSQQNAASTVTLPDRHQGLINVFNLTLNDLLISRGPPSHRFFIKELLPQLLKDMEEQFLLAGDTMSPWSVSFADIATDWFLDVGQGCCDSAEPQQKSEDSDHVSPRGSSFTTPAPEGGADNIVYNIIKPVVPVALFMFSAAVYVTAMLCQRCAARFKPKKLNSTVHPVIDVITVAHMTELQPAVALPSYEEVIRIPLEPGEVVNLGPPPTYEEESAGVVTYI